MSSTVPERPRVSDAVIPVAAAVSALVTGLLQLLAMQVWGGRRGMDLRDVLMQWDSQWMTLISEYGYSGFVMSADQTDPVEWESVAFFPGYPVLVRIVAAPSAVLDGTDSTYIAALVVSAVASLLLAWGASRLATDMWERMRGRSGRPSVGASVCLTATVTVLVFGAPMGVVYWMPYSEGLFTALTVWTLVFLLRRRYLVAGALVLLAGLTRLTAAALILVLCIAAVMEAREWWRARQDPEAPAASRPAFPARAVAAPVIGSLGIIAYLVWANNAVAEIGGYFAAQERGWHSGFDVGAATLRWLAGNLSGDTTGYVVSSWSMILVALLCAASVWPLVRGWIPWQVWLTGVVTAGIVLGSDGIMHSRPRLLLLPVLLLLLPFVVRAVRWVWEGPASRRRTAGLGVVAVCCVLWCVLGVWVSGQMLIDFDYAI
ncbi:MAG: hypothetical protein ACTIL2_03465 [Corynebacterium sp.]|uniref:hypothetical protein n=1 Tax=Corynebacterium sp. TaxID=1720 RepID=UPI003F9D00A5